MPETFSLTKRASQGFCLDRRNDAPRRDRYVGRMADPRHDWYLQQWLRTLKKRQSDIARDLDWNKAKVSLTASGKQPYSRDDVNEVAKYLNLEPYELLMDPADAMAIRQLRASAEEIVTLAHKNEPANFFDAVAARDKRQDDSRTEKTKRA